MSGVVVRVYLSSSKNAVLSESEKYTRFLKRHCEDKSLVFAFHNYIRTEYKCRVFIILYQVYLARRQATR